MATKSPILDPAPTGRPHDYQLSRIQEALGVTLAFDSRYKNPYVSTDADGDVYVCDLWNYRVKKYTSTGVFIKSWS